eukprot:TRINITY_DN11574_c0_g1_i2.p3 TRINITY_DN11574_c0_g1~~TRINITY_DN11574_c0_g1_i2.p3  ORF type:complete len:147 (-),score=42.28 TRINITY_DN11574_c0_g1_i2:183-623(-)
MVEMRGGQQEAETGQGVQGGEEVLVMKEGGKEAGQGALHPTEEVEAEGRIEEVEALWKRIGGGELQTEVIRGEALEMEENPEELEKTETTNMIKEMIEVKEGTGVIPEKGVLPGDIKKTFVKIELFLNCVDIGGFIPNLNKYLYKL